MPRSLDLCAPWRNDAVMLAAALTVWILFSFWLLVPLLRLPSEIGRVAAVLLAAELGALLVWSYGSEGCIQRTCAPIAQAAGIAARTDIPILAAVCLAFAGLLIARGRLAAPSIEADGHLAPADHAGERARGV